MVERTGFEGLLPPVGNVVLVGGAMSPSTRVNALVLKRRFSAWAGVPFSLVVDPKGGTFPLEIHGAEYVEVAREADGALVLDRPFPVTIALSGESETPGPHGTGYGGRRGDDLRVRRVPGDDP